MWKVLIRKFKHPRQINRQHDLASNILNLFLCFFFFSETVKDLIRFLKREDETCDIRQQLGQAQILQNDLIPLVKHYKKDRALQECVIRYGYVFISDFQDQNFCGLTILCEYDVCICKFCSSQFLLYMCKLGHEIEVLTNSYFLRIKVD